MFSRKRANNKGQTLVEFVFLLAIIMTLSITLLAGINGGIATRWKYLITLVVSNNNEDPVNYAPRNDLNL